MVRAHGRRGTRWPRQAGPDSRSQGVRGAPRASLLALGLPAPGPAAGAASRECEVAPHPIDAFILAALEPRRLAPAEPVDRRKLLRRVTFDLAGLPPTPEEVEQFVRDPDPSAYEKLVDRLLASPRYGERWGRGATYGETDEIGFKAAVDRTSVNDLHATMLHLLGIDHQRLTYFHNGRSYRLTDVAGTILTKILA